MRFSDHTAGDLTHVATALTGGRLSAPFSIVSLSRLGVSDPGGLAEELNALAQLGFQSAQISILLRTLADERRLAERLARNLELVVTGPDLREQARDTSVIVEQLFADAKKSVLLVGFALYGGNALFARLAQRLDETPALSVVLCLDISRRGTDTTKDSDLVARYAHDFKRRHWSGKRFPKIYFDPRGLTMEASKRAVLHAKCIVIDEKIALVTSANPTPAAYTKNIEVGVVVRDGLIPSQIANHFSSLIQSGAFRQLDL